MAEVATVPMLDAGAPVDDVEAALREAGCVERCYRPTGGFVLERFAGGNACRRPPNDTADEAKHQTARQLADHRPGS